MDVLYVLIVPVLIGFFRKQISDFITDAITYKNRKFDDDGDPATGQDCYIQCAATGQYISLYIKEYRFGILPSSRRVVTVQNYYDMRLTVTYTYEQWRGLVKGKKIK